MSSHFHDDPIAREDLITAYLQRRLSPALAEAWESHYLACDDCFAQMRATELLIRGLGEPLPQPNLVLAQPNLVNVERNLVNDVTVLRFGQGAQLLAASLELAQLATVIRDQKDTKVLIDLSRVSRIDSTGLGVLMNCYCHAVKNAGALKLLRADAPVRRVLSVTKIDSLLPIFEDEATAIASFRANSQ
jgi:anti-sigma B factor antagonist